MNLFLEKEYHGETGTRLYRIWKAMKTRGSNPNIFSSHLYYDKGVRVCNEWKNSYISFRNWAMINGYSKELSIDRIDNDGNYEPSNCRWATRLEQNNNTSQNVNLTYKGKTQSISNWGRELNINNNTLSARYNRNYSVEQILGFEPLKYNYKPSKPVVQLDMEGNYIREFESVKSAKSYINSNHVSSCCTGKRKSCGGFKWQHKEDWLNE